MVKRQYISVVVMFCLAIFLSACMRQGANLEIDDIWARPGLKDGNSAAFFQLTNSTETEDRLLDVKSDIAAAVEIHQTQMVDGVMQMEKQPFVPIPPGEQTNFQPGGLHIMLIGLVRSLNTGDEFQLSLVFEKSGEIIVQVKVIEP